MSFEVGLLLGVLIGLGAGGLFVWRVTTDAAEEWIRDNWGRIHLKDMRHRPDQDV